MATGKRYYWIKLKESFMTSDAVDFLMGQPDGANYVVLYQMLCLKTINTDGRLSRRIGEVIIPYDEQKIARDTKWFSVDTVRVALHLYKALGLVYQDQDGVLALTDHENLVGSETDWAVKKRRQALDNNSPGLLPSSGESDGENFPIEIDIENRDKEIENRDKEIEEKQQPRARFVPPSIQDVATYCAERNNGVDAQRFVDYYTANGWKVGKNPMKDWKAAVRTWERNRKGEQHEQRRNPQPDRSSGFNIHYD